MSFAKPQVVIVGGGFGGLYCARTLRNADVGVTLVDRRNFHLFQPLLYQVATGGLSPANIAAPLRGVLKRQKNATVLMGEVRDFDLVHRQVFLAGGANGRTECSQPPIGLPFDYLVVAAGMENDYFGHDEWARFAPGLKTLEDATEMRRQILSAFEAAERTPVFTEQLEWLTFVVIGGGPTGLELAGTLAEIARDTLRRDFRRVRTQKARILLIEAAERVLPGWPADLSEAARRQAETLGVEVWTGTNVVAIREAGVTVKTAAGEQQIATRTVLWGAGVRGSGLGVELARGAGVEVDRVGRVPVLPDCSVPGHANIFVIGDLARFEDERGRPLPGVAPVAMQQGNYLARLIDARLRGRTLAAFRYHDKGRMATIGRAAAVAEIGRLRFSGYLAWLAWLLVHIFFLIQFQNRLLVMIQWAWNYFTFARSARIITETALSDDVAQRRRG